MNFDQMTEKEIRAEAKARKIRNHHNKNIERLKKEILECDQETGKWSVPENSFPKLSWSQVLDCLDGYAMRHLSDSVEALDVLGKPYAKNFVEWFSKYVQRSNKGEVQVANLYEGYKQRYGGMSKDYFQVLLEKTCDVYRGRGWKVEDGMFHFTKATFPLDYHTQVWSITKKVHNTASATRILTVLMGEDEPNEKQ